eukprot:TRINITY_DN7477_c0_g1_i1.p1 TRINITY_DN7477_c0_g1~~TRINITY_DN7477_c0_g1_i1.p1  ORF type:complete len:579 (+),score=139.73 TRINITY_DN7477_c0_g1_i1:70-1806(+)
MKCFFFDRWGYCAASLCGGTVQTQNQKECGGTPSAECRLAEPPKAGEESVEPHKAVEGSVEPPKAVEESVESPLECEAEQIEKTCWLHPGDAYLPPMVQVQLNLKVGSRCLKALVKPPDPERLWDWYVERGLDEADPSWANVWPSSAALAGFIAANPSLVEGQHVAELGAGLGLVGLVAACAGAKDVTLLDREPLSLHCAMASAQVNSLTVEAVPETPTVAETSETGIVRAAKFDWSQATTFPTSVDVALAAEVLYDKSSVPELAATVVSLFRSNRQGSQPKPVPKRLLLTDPLQERVAGVRAAFVESLEKSGAKVIITSLETPPLGDGLQHAGAVVLIDALWQQWPQTEDDLVSQPTPASSTTASVVQGAAAFPARRVVEAAPVALDAKLAPLETQRRPNAQASKTERRAATAPKTAAGRASPAWVAPAAAAAAAVSSAPPPTRKSLGRGDRPPAVAAPAAAAAVSSASPPTRKSLGRGDRHPAVAAPAAAAAVSSASPPTRKSLGRGDRHPAVAAALAAAAAGSSASPPTRKSLGRADRAVRESGRTAAGGAIGRAGVGRGRGRGVTTSDASRGRR